jgi:GT2 family glycosyltransferase
VRALPADVTVAVPSSYRPVPLARCLDALGAQTVKPAEIVVVLRSDDAEGAKTCVSRKGVRVVEVDREGLMPARYAGLRSITTTWVAFMDDDAEAAPDWCERLAAYFADPTVGCVGGPIVNFVGTRSTSGWFTAGEPVARIGYAGRMTSHLHDQADTRRVEDVDFLPGSNMALRGELARRADHGRAPGLAPGEELEWCLTVKDAGYRVVYDSAIRVAHYPAERRGAPAREDKVAHAYAFGYTMTYTILRHVGFARAAAFLAYTWLIGHRVCPGAAMAPFYVLRPSGLAKTASGMKGRLRATLDSLRAGK